jgi:hypothetical protein
MKHFHQCHSEGETVCTLIYERKCIACMEIVCSLLTLPATPTREKRANILWKDTKIALNINLFLIDFAVSASGRNKSGDQTSTLIKVLRSGEWH